MTSPPMLKPAEAFTVALFLGFTLGLFIGATIIERNFKSYAEAHR